MGKCNGGEPNILQWFQSASEAERTLLSGELLDAVKHAFAPGGGLVPALIAAWRVNPGTQSTYQYLKTATAMIIATARDYGLHTNQLKTKLEAGTGSGKKVTIQFKDNDPEVWDTVEKASFQILYSGAVSGAMTITKTQLSTTCDTPADDLTMLFTTFTTIEEIVNYINDQANYTCTLLTSTPSDASTELDSVSAVDIRTGAYDALSDLQAIIDVLNESAWVTAAFNTGASDRDIPDNVAAWAYFTGAVDGAYTSGEWIAALALLESEDIQMIGASSADASIHALIKNHCVSMCSVTGKSERQYIVGGAAGETPAQTVTRSENLASEYGAIAFPGIKHYHFTTGALVTSGPVAYAAKLIGLFTVLALNEPATNKDVDCLGWEDALTYAERDLLVKGGVICGFTNKAGRRVTVRSVTNHQGTELQKCEFSMMREALFAARDLRTAVEESFVGKAMSNRLIAKVDTIVQGKLSGYRDLEIFNGDPPYWGYNKTIIGDVIDIEYNCHLTPPTNFVFITSNMHVYASTS